MTFRFRALSVFVATLAFICAQGHAVIIWDELGVNPVPPSITGDLDSDVSLKTFNLVEGINEVVGTFFITKIGPGPFGTEYSYDIDNFDFTVSGGFQLNSISLDLGLSDINTGGGGGGPPDWGTGSLNYDLTSPVADSYKNPDFNSIDPHTDRPSYSFSGSFPLSAGSYQYRHSLTAIGVDDANFVTVTTPYSLKLTVGRAGGGSPTPTPDSGSTILLSLLGLSCLFAAKRYSKK